MRAAIFRNGEIVVDTAARAEARRRARCWSRRWPAASAAPTCTRASTPIAWSNWPGIFPAASRWTSPATSCSATNSAARSSTTARRPRASCKPGTRVCSLPALLTPEGPQGIGYSNDNIGGYAERMLLSEALLLEVPNGLARRARRADRTARGRHPRGREGQYPRRRGAAGDRLRPGRARGHRGAEAEGVASDRRRRLFAGAPRAGRRSSAPTSSSIRRSRSPMRPGPSTPRCRRSEKAARPPLQALLPALKPALIFECVGIPGLMQQVFEGAPRDARIVVVGVCMETDRSEPMLGIMKELNVQYVLGYTPDEFAHSLRLIAEGEVDAASLVTATRRHRRRRRRRSPISPIRKRTPRSSSSRGGRWHRTTPIVRRCSRISGLPRTGNPLPASNLAQRFQRIHDTNLWGAAESPSGLGSEIDATAVLRAELPPLLARLGVTSLLDAPCGDAGWINRADLGVRYVGVDIVPASDRASAGRAPRRATSAANIISPISPAIRCRDATPSCAATAWCICRLPISNVRSRISAAPARRG